MPSIVNTEIGQIRFSDEYTPDQIAEILRTRLPAWREGLKRSAASDIGTRLLYEPAMAATEEVKSLTRGAQNISDFLRKQRFRETLPEATTEEQKLANERLASGFEQRLEATKEQRLRESSPAYQLAEQGQQAAQNYLAPNPTRENALPTTAIRGVSRVLPKLAEAAALETILAPVAAVAAPVIAATKVGRMVPAMLSAGAAFGVTPEGQFSPKEAAIAAGTVPAFGAGEAIATKLLERLPIKNVHFDVPPSARQALREAQALGQTIEQAPTGFTASVEQKLSGLPIGETGRKAIEQTGGILAANAYLTALQAPGILKLPDEQRGPAIADLLTSQVAMSLLGYLPVLGGQPSKANREIWNRIAKEVKEKYGAEPNSEPPAPAAGLPEPKTPSGGAAPSDIVSTEQPSAEQRSAEEAAIVADIQRRQQMAANPESTPVPPPVPQPEPQAPRRRSPAIVPETERPRFRPPMPAPAQPTPPVSISSPSSEEPKMDIRQNLPGPPEATTSVVPEAQQKGAKPSAPPLPEPGTPADEFGAVYGPNLSPEAMARLNAANEESFVIDETQDSITTLDFRGNKIKVTSEEKTQSPLKRLGIAYLVVQPNGSTILTGSFVRTPESDINAKLSNLAKDKLVSLINSGLTFRASPQPQETPNAISQQSTDAGVLRPETPQPEQQVGLPQVGARNAEPQVAAGTETKTPQAQGQVDWFANLGSVSTDELETAKTFRKDAANLRKEADALRAQAKEIEKRIIRTTGPRYERGKIKKSASKADVEEYRTLTRRAADLDNARRILEERTTPAEVASAIRIASDTSLPLLRRLNARADLFGLQQQREPEEFLAELDRATREEVRRLFPDASPAEEEQLRGPVRRAFMGSGDVQSALQLDPELNLNARRWSEIANAYVDTEALQQRFPEDLQEIIRKANNYKLSGRRESLTPITRAETDRILTAIPKAKAKAQADVVEEQRQAAEASAQMERDFTRAVKTDEVRSAKEAKNTLVRELENALSAAPEEQHGKASVTIEIPGDGTFKILNNKAAIQTVLDNATRLSTTTSFPRNYTERGVTKEQAKQYAEEAKMTPEEIAAYRAEKGLPKLSITLQELPDVQVSAKDIERAFPAAQGFAVKPVRVLINEKDGSTTESVGYLVKLPNGSAILIDPNREVINFDPNKAAADWGIDPQLLAEQGIARGAFTANGVSIEGLSQVGLIDLLRTAGPDTLSHEKFHAFFAMVLTPEERVAILDRYKTEEKAAEAFRRSEGFTRSFWEKIKRFIEWLKNLFRGDVFEPIRRPLSKTLATEPTGRAEPQYSLEQEMRNPKQFEERLAKPITSPEEAISLRRQAGAGAGLVPEPIAQEIRSLNPDDPVEGRIASRLDFVLKLRDVAPALNLKSILDDPSIPDDTKQASISNVLRQIEHVRVETDKLADELQEATTKLERAIRQGEKITAQRLVETKAKQIAANLLTGYRAYLTAQAANLPADQNLAAARADLIRRMRGVIDQEESRSPDAIWPAIKAIAARIDELPVAEGPQAVADAIRQKGILKGVVGDDTIDLLTAEMVGGLPPLLVNPEANALLLDLANLQQKAELYAKQIETVEQAFRGKGEPTPVQLKRFAETYRKFRNKQADAAKAIAEMDKQFREADQDVQVYGRSHEILTRLQNDPQFRDAFESAIERPGGHVYDLFADIKAADQRTGLITYLSPLKTITEDGKVIQNKFTASLAPDREADSKTISDMLDLLDEVEQFLAQPNIDPIEARSWRLRRDYIQQHVLPAAYGMKQIGGQLETRYGIIPLNPFHWIKTVLGGAAAAPRSELERLSYRAARDLNDDFLTTDLVRNQFVRIGNNRAFGDEVTKILVLKALKSHGWGTDKIGDLNARIINPIIASGQTAAQLRLRPGMYVPGTGLEITKEDYELAQKEKQWSQSIVNTTQGVGKKLPPALIQNPILIEDTFQGRKVRRSALSPGPLTMARRFSASGLGITQKWFEQGATEESRMNLIREGVRFERSVLSYVTTTNPEFNRQSSLNPVYEAYTADAVKQPDLQVKTFDQLVDRLATIAVNKGMFPSTAEAIPAIGKQLFAELGPFMEAYRNAVAAEAPGRTTETNPRTLMDFASAANAFTRRRGEMLAPDAFYDYTLTEGNDRIGFVAAAYQQFQLRNIAGMEQFLATLRQVFDAMSHEIETLHENTGVTHRKAAAIIQKRSEAQLEEKKFTYRRLEHVIRTLEKVQKSFRELVIDRRDKNDAFMLYAMSRLQSTLSSALLANPTAIANNLAGGILTSNFILQQNIGRANLLLSQIGSTKHTVKTLVNRVIKLTHADTPIGVFARSNIPILRTMARAVDGQLRDWIQMHAELEAWGLRSVPDKKSRLAAMAALKATAGAIETGDISLLNALPNYVESFPGLRQFFVHLRDMSPRVVDEFINEMLAESYRRDVYAWLKKAALNAFEARAQRAKATGRKDINDFTKLSNLLTPAELGLGPNTGYRDLENLRDLFHSMGSLDTFLLDYYNRWNAAPENEQANVPLFKSPEAEGQMTFNLAAHANIPTAGFTPPSMQGVGQRGLIKRIIFMFRNYTRRMSEQIEKLSDFDLRDPKMARRAKLFWQMFSLLIVAALAGALAIEIGGPVTKLLTGRTPAKLTAANVLSDPDAASMARYLGMTLANNIPYYGDVISRMVGNPGYGNLWDVTDLVPMFGLVKDATIAATKIAQTGDPLFPTVDFISRWFPPGVPALRLLPGVEGDIEAKNAARALRVVGPSEGIELAGGGGGQTTQSPASASIRRLISAAYSGDQAGIQSAFDEAVREKAAQGSPNPEKAVLQAIASREPARVVFGRAITPAEEARLIGRMSGTQRASYSNAQNAFSLINQTLGTKYQLTSTPRERTRGQASRRALFSEATPTFGRRSRRRKLGARRRRPFARLQIRGAAKRKRRSPTRLSFSA